MLKGKTVVLGVSSSIAAYKAANLASRLVKCGCDVHVIMTKNAMNFITPLTFEELTKNKCITDTFERNSDYEVEHIALAQKADIFLVAPATANVIGKIANGIADDMLTTTIMAAKCPKLISPAMNTNMFENPIVSENLEKLCRFGYTVIPPDSGRLACGTEGKGRFPAEETIISYIEYALCKKDLKGKRVLVTAGPTRESIDPVRYITNHSSGKMGYAVAEAAMQRGAEVTLISGPVNIAPLNGVKTVNITTAEEMYNSVISEAENADIIVKAAAVADFRPTVTAENKIKKSSGKNAIELESTKDILKAVGNAKKEGQFICGFSMETENMLENSKKKLKSKNLDMIVCNNIHDNGAGFSVDTNVVTLLTKDDAVPLSLLSKKEVAHKIFDKILEITG